MINTKKIKYFLFIALLIITCGKEQVLSQSVSPLTNLAASNDQSVFSVKKIEVVGNTILHKEIDALIKPLENTEITFEELLELRSQITELYIERGYITSGAFLPNNQVMTNNVITIQVIEGELEDIKTIGLKRLPSGYVRNRIALKASKPLNINSIREALQLLELDPRVEQVVAELKPGSSVNSSILVVEVQEARAFNLGVGIDNYRSPDIGSIEGSIFVDHQNLLGLGDRFFGQYGRTEGLNIYDIIYTIPVSPRNATLSLRYGNNNSTTIREEFQDLDITSETNNFTLSFRHPVVRKPSLEFGLGLELDLVRNKTFLLGEPFSFSIGAEDGKSNLTVIRFFQDWVYRDVNRVLAARSQFSFGINAFNATINDTGTDGRFFAWLGQFQWVERLSSRVLLLVSVNAQLTPDSLLIPERFSLGGIDTIKGYRQNQILTDNAIFAVMEFRIPVTYNPDVLQLIPFVNAGGGWNNQTLNPDPSFLASLGLGINWQIIDNLNLRLDYGIPLVYVEQFGSSLQDNGFYFSLTYNLF